MKRRKYVTGPAASFCPRNVPMNKRIRFIAAALTLAGSAWAQAPESQPVRTADILSTAPAETFGGVSHARNKVAPKTSGTLSADFTIAGADALKPVFTENFDAGKGSWTWDDTQYVNWSVKRIAEEGSDKSFSSIDPADVGSLFVEGPYQIYRRERSSAYSPSYFIPERATLVFYVGFSQNYDDCCRLNLTAQTGSETTEIWSSKNETGEKVWRWHRVEVSLNDFAAKDVVFCFTYDYGSKDENFKTGGYLGDFAIDGFAISAPQAVEKVELTTGQKLSLVDNSQGEIVSWQWSMPGAVPETSTAQSPEVYYTADGDYDISLTVRDASGNESTKTRPSFVHVTGTSPVARIIPPATFRLSSTRKHLVAPLVPVTWRDGSEGFPSERYWAFTGACEDSKEVFSSTDSEVSVSYAFLHDQVAALQVSNQHGQSAATSEVSVEYGGVVCNLQSQDSSTEFDMNDWGIFPGSNTIGITAYAEHFSKPSRPIVVNGAYVYFNRAKTTEVVEQIAPVSCSIYTCKDGKPDRRLDFMSWSVFELDMPSESGSMVGTAFPFTEAPVIDDEFFIVVSGIPEFNEGCCVSFGMAGFRPDGNSAMILKDGEWISVPDYFGKDKCTSFMIYPSVIHSVMSPLPAGTSSEIEVGAKAGQKDYQIFSYMGYKTPVESDSPWLHVDSEPNGMTVDTLKIGYDALPAGIKERTGHLTLTDGASTMTITVNQKETSAVSDFVVESGAQIECVYNLQGINLGKEMPKTSGVYLVRYTDGSVSKIVRR